MITKLEWTTIITDIDNFYLNKIHSYPQHLLGKRPFSSRYLPFCEGSKPRYQVVVWVVAAWRSADITAGCHGARWPNDVAVPVHLVMPKNEEALVGWVPEPLR